MTVSRAPVMRDVVEEHLDESAFLWSQWERALNDPRRTLDQVAADAEKRLLANLKGLEVAGAGVVQELLATEEPNEGRAFAASLVMLETGPEGLPFTVALLSGKSIPVRRGAALALCLCRRAGFERDLVALVERGDLSAQAAALDALAFRGQPPPVSLRAFLASRDARIRSAALRGARHGGLMVRREVAAFLEAPEPNVRDAAIESGLVIGLLAAYRAARRAVDLGAPEPTLPLAVLAMSGDPADLERIEATLGTPELRAPALRALAASGWPRAADLALPFLEDERLARLAAEVVSSIGGLAIGGPYALPEPLPPDEPIPFEKEDLDRDLVPHPDDALPLPDPFGVSGWWTRERARFDPAVRHLSGRPLDPESMVAALRQGRMRRRPPLARELAVRSVGAFQLEPRTWAREQRRFLETRRLAVRSGFGAPFARLLVT